MLFPNTLYVSFVLPGKVRLPKGYTQEQLRAAILAEIRALRAEIAELKTAKGATGQ